MEDNLLKNKEVQKLLFMEVMNNDYFSPEEIKYRIPPSLQNEQVLDVILGMRKRKLEPIYPLEDQKNQSLQYWKTARI